MPCCYFKGWNRFDTRHSSTVKLERYLLLMTMMQISSTLLLPWPVWASSTTRVCTGWSVERMKTIIHSHYSSIGDIWSKWHACKHVGSIYWVDSSSYMWWDACFHPLLFCKYQELVHKIKLEEERDVLKRAPVQVQTNASKYVHRNSEAFSGRTVHRQGTTALKVTLQPNMLLLVELPCSNQTGFKNDVSR